MACHSLDKSSYAVYVQPVLDEHDNAPDLTRMINAMARSSSFLTAGPKTLASQWLQRVSPDAIQTALIDLADGQSWPVRLIGQGQPVLLLCGLGMSSWQWLPFVSALWRRRQQFQLIMPDFRGFGQAQHLPIPALNAIESHWRDLSALLEQLELSQLLVIGYSMGATTTMHGLKYGQFADRIQRYLHIDQSPRIKNAADWPFGLMGQQQPQMLEFMQKVTTLIQPYQGQTPSLPISELPAPVRAQLIALCMDYIRLQNRRILPGALQPLVLQSLPFKTVDYLAWYLESYLAHDEDYREAMLGLQRPVTWMMGQQSALYPVEGQLAVAQHMPDCDIVMMEKSGHTPLLNQPLQFQRQMIDFIVQR